MKYTIKIILLLAFITIKIHSQEQRSLAKPVNLGPQLFQVSINIASNQGLIYTHQPGTDKATSLGKPLPSDTYSWHITHIINNLITQT